MVLGLGKEIYFGNTKTLIKYFESIGKPIPEYVNPTDHILDLINVDFIGDNN